MIAMLSILAGVTTAVACLFLLEGNRFRMVLGVVLLGQAANLVLFTAAGVADGTSAIVPAEATQLPANAADPLAQAMILTAIVIGFGVAAFCLFLVSRATAEGPADSDSEVDEWES